MGENEKYCLSTDSVDMYNYKKRRKLKCRIAMNVSSELQLNHYFKITTILRFTQFLFSMHSNL